MPELGENTRLKASVKTDMRRSSTGIAVIYGSGRTAAGPPVDTRKEHEGGDGRGLSPHRFKAPDGSGGAEIYPEVCF